MRNQTPPLPAAVLFDLDNTLYEYDCAHRAGLDAVRAKAHVQLGAAHTDFDRVFDAARSEMKARLKNSAGSHSRLLYFQRLIELLGLKTQPVLSLDFEQTYWRTYLGASTLYPGVTDFLEELHTLGIPRVIVTDLTTQIQFRKLVYFRIESFFEAIVTSEEIGIEKPAPEMFTTALAKIRLERGPVWMVGDSVEKDMAGAKSALDAFTLHRVEASLLPRPKHSMVDMTFSSFKELTELLYTARAGNTRPIAAVS